MLGVAVLARGQLQAVGAAVCAIEPQAQIEAAREWAGERAGERHGRDAGILDGDLLAVHATSKANSGDLVVARIDGEVTVRRFQRKGGKVALLAANPDFAPIEVDPRKHEFVIEGVGVLRNLA